MEELDESQLKEIEKAALILKEGGVVIFPTDTVYGIGCRYDFPRSARRIRQIKDTGQDQQFPILVSDVGQVFEIAKVTEVAKELIEKYWPGGLTLILEGKNKDKVGLRMPDSLFTRTLIEEVGMPIIGTSANFHGKATPRSFEHLDKQFKKLADYTIKGECKSGKESTVVDTTVTPPKVLRRGAVSINFKTQ